MRTNCGLISSICSIGLVCCLRSNHAAQASEHLSRPFSVIHPQHGHWTDLNIGPFYVDTDRDVAAARDALTQLEQLRWVLGGLLESKDLPSVWALRLLLTGSEKITPTAAPRFILQNGTYILDCPPGTRLPLDQVAGILLEANTPRLPPEVESGVRQLFSTLEAKGSRVTWGGPPAHPDLAWARMQLFATKFEYSSSFHIFFTALRSGSTLRAAEQNAFGKDSATLEQEAAANLASHNWPSVSVSGRPLDPKRDFGEHSLDDATAAVYRAKAQLASAGKSEAAGTENDSAEAAFKSAIAAGGASRALGYEGLAAIAELAHDNPKPFLDNAIRAGSRNATVYVSAADGLDPAQALPLLKRAAQLNPLWAEPIFRQAQLSPDPASKEALLKKAIQLDPRATPYWIELAQLQTTQGEGTAAQGTWLRAEDSAADAPERARVHQLRLDSEQERLDAAENARRRERESVHLADERAQQSEADRIRAAEQKANSAKDAAAGDQKPANVVPWNEIVPTPKRISGTLIQVDCLGAAAPARLSIKDRTGSTVQLLLKDPSRTGLTCGPQHPARRVSLTYAPQPDDAFHTSGSVVSMHLQ